MRDTFRKRVKAMKVLLRLLLIAYLLVMVLLAFLQRKLIYFPTTADRLPVAAFADVTALYPAAADVRMRSEDNVEIAAWLLTNEPVHDSGNDSRRPLVLLFHGNAGDRSHRFGWYDLLSRCSTDVLAIDYHGYAESGGKPSEAALYQDGRAAWKYATETLKYRPSQILVMGVSLGGAVAVHLVSEQSHAGEPPAGLVVVATFSSMVDVASGHYPWLPVRAVLADRYPSDSRIGLVTCPVLQFHGDRDRVVPQQFGRRLFAAVPEQSASAIAKRWVNLPGIGHNDLLSGGRRLIHAELAAFTKRTFAE